MWLTCTHGQITVSLHSNVTNMLRWLKTNARQRIFVGGEQLMMVGSTKPNNPVFNGFKRSLLLPSKLLEPTRKSSYTFET